MNRFITIAIFSFLSIAMLSAQEILGKRTVSVTEIGNGVWRLRFGSPEYFTPENFRIEEVRLEDLERLEKTDGIHPVVDKITCEIQPTRTLIRIPFSSETEDIYGFGLDPGAYIQNGLRKQLSVSAKVVTKTGASHGPVPLLICSAGFGVYVETARVPFVHVGNLNRKEQAVEAKMPDEQEIIFDLPGNNSGVDVIVFAGPSMRQVVQRYNLYSGGGAMPPMYGLGMKYRTYTKGDKALVYDVAKQLREEGIPCDMMGLEPGWHTHAYSCSFVWSDKRFPNHQEMIDTLVDKGFKINLWEHAYIHPTSPLFKPLYPKSGDFLVWDGLVVDFADTMASDLFGTYHRNYLMQKGISGFKLDECDRQPISDATPFNYPYISKFPSGIEGDQMTQLYGFLYQKSLYKEFRKSNIRSWNDVRATSGLSSPLPFNLYSDAYALDEYLRQLVNASFSGLLWSPEVRKAENYPDLLNRVALAAFAPQMCLNIWIYPHPVWQQYNVAKNKAGVLLPPNEQEKILDQLRTLTTLRMSLLPYLYSSFYQYHKTGLPAVRSLLIDFDHHADLAQIDDQFMFGESIMVAPYTTDSCNRWIYFPRGIKWIDFFTREEYQGGDKVLFKGEPGQIPLFVKNNSLIPLADPELYVSDSTQFHIRVVAFGKNPEPFVLFEDDGLSYDFENGSFNEVRLSIKNKLLKVSRTGDYPGVRYVIKGALSTDSAYTGSSLF